MPGFKLTFDSKAVVGGRVESNSDVSDEEVKDGK